MTPDRERDAARICDALLDCPALERETFIVEESAGDEALRREVELLFRQLDDPPLYPRAKSDATVVEFADDRDHVSDDIAEQKRFLVVQAGSEDSTTQPIALEALREELKTTQLTIKDSVAAASALRSEMDSLSALANEIRVAYISVQVTDDPFLHFRSEYDATGVEFADEGDHVSGDTAKRKRILVAQAGSEGSTIEPIALEALREELKATQLTIRDSMAAASALRSEMHSLSALASEIRAKYSSLQETARGALERGATVELRLGAIESRLGPLGDLEDVRREIEKRFDALNALAEEVRANTDAVNRRRGLVEQLAVETAAQPQRREQRDVELGREMARSQSVQAFSESAWRPGWELVDRLKAGGAADEFRSPGAATRAQRSLTIGKVAQCVQRGRTALRANVWRSSLGLTGARNAAWRAERKLTVAIGNLRRSSLLSMHGAETTANLRVSKTIVLIKYVEVAAVFTMLALVSAFVLDSVRRTADLVGPPVDPPVVTPTAPVPSTAVPDLPSGTSATTSPEGSLDFATTMQSLTSTRQVASVDVETPATRRATEFVGALSIRSTPDKAEVHIDRERVGETPLILPRLRAGAHAIWIEHDGYQRWTAGLNVPAGELTEVTATLQAEPGR